MIASFKDLHGNSTPLVVLKFVQSKGRDPVMQTSASQGQKADRETVGSLSMRYYALADAAYPLF